MPLYEYRCLDCETRFDAFRPVDRANDAPPCPDGHGEVVRMLSLVGSPRRGADGASAEGGGACGGACACSH